MEGYYGDRGGVKLVEVCGGLQNYGCAIGDGLTVSMSLLDASNCRNVTES